MRKRTLSSLLVAALLVTGLTACNTIAGIGRDIQSAGETVEDVAD